MGLRINIFMCLSVLLLSACAPGLEDQFRREGVGISLHTDATDENTDNLRQYFESLCDQADFSNKNCTPPPGYFAPSIWRILIETGYNDIDLRCDAYLNWIESKRSERIFVNSTSTAVGTLVGGVLGVASASPEALAYTALALGFTESLYDAYYSRILLGLEASTIKEVVNQRRLAHRQEFAKNNYLTRPQAVFALRRYLTICTPQSILTDVNIYSRDAANGRGDTARRDTVRAASLIPTSNTGAGPGPRNPDAIRTNKNVAEIFLGDGFTDEDIKTLQNGSCIAVDGKPKAETKTAVQIIEQTLSYNGATTDLDGKINRNEWEQIHATLEKGCQKDVLKNYFENSNYGAMGNKDSGAGIVLQLVAKNVLPQPLKGKTLKDSDVRNALADARRQRGVDEKVFPGGTDVSNQLTPRLYQNLFPDN